MKNKTLILIPYFEDIAITDLCNDLASQDLKNVSLIIVDDGSINIPFNKKHLEDNNLTGEVIYLKKNVGHQMAIAIGINYIVENLTFDKLVIMDGDGEDKPSDISTLIDKLDQQDDLDIIVAERTSRHESFKFKIFYLIYKLLFSVLTGKKLIHGNFMIMRQRAVERLSHLSETRIHLAASTLKSKLRIGNLPLARGKRYQGKSKMNLVSLTLHGISSITVFSERVLARMTLFCAFSAAIILFFLLVLVALKITGLTIIGWFSTISGILLLMLLQIGVMALLVLLLAGNQRPSSSGQIRYMDFIKEVVNV